VKKIVLVAGSVLFVIFVSLIFARFHKDKEAKVVHTLSFKVLVKDADSLAVKGRLLEAKRLYKKAQEATKDTGAIAEMQRKIEETNIKILFSPLMDECSAVYVVKPNDSLSKISKKFYTTVALIKRANGLSSDVIRPMQKLKINTNKFSIVVDKSQNLLFLKRKGEIIKTYVVSTGKDNSTPTGNFKIVNKLKKPVWFKAGAVVSPDSPDNVLGSRWLGLDMKGYGIHGTTSPKDLGKQITLGCVRMNNKDVEDLFDIVPLGTEVTIVD